MKTKSASTKKIKKLSGQLTIGIDIGDVWSHYCTLSEGGEVIEEGRFRTTPEGVAKQFAGIDAVRVAIENGTHSIWINEQLRGYGHEVIVANVQELQAISRSDRKSDRVDAEKLARYARLDPSILRPITHRSVAMQQDLTVVRARDVLVRLRTATINAVRGLVKPCGFGCPNRLQAALGNAAFPPFRPVSPLR
jgi:transposase